MELQLVIFTKLIRPSSLIIRFTTVNTLFWSTIYKVIDARLELHLLTVCQYTDHRRARSLAGPRPFLPSRTVEQEALSAKRTEEEFRGFQFPILIIVKCLRQRETAAIIFLLDGSYAHS